ncbi:MAG: hypothetical protein AAF438_17010 [Pseudomonadota bacterium]
MNNQQPVIRGPIVSAADMKPHQDFFANLFSMESTEIRCCNELFNSLSDGPIQTCFVATPKTPFGIRLWQFDPTSKDTVRDKKHGTQPDALKVIDFYAPDFETALQKTKTKGFAVQGDIAEYKTEDGVFREAHLWRDDNVVCAILSGPKQFMKDFATIQDEVFSEPMAISAPVSRAADVLEFYNEVFGFKCLHEYQVKDNSFDALVGTENAITLRASNLGTHLKAPFLGVIDYGISSSDTTSLKGRSRPPTRGLVGVEISVPNLDETLSKAVPENSHLLMPPTHIANYPPYGACVAAALEGPHGVLHFVLQLL